MYRGVAVSPGVVVAPAYCLDEVFARTHEGELTPADAAKELACFDLACEESAVDLRALIEKVSFEIGEKESGIFQAHLLMLRDRAFLGKVKTLIVDRACSASTALAEAIAEYEDIFRNIKDEYLRERIVDLRDVVARIQNHLVSDQIVEHLSLNETVILVARELFPSQTVSFGKLKIAGIVTELGGGTGHAAIIARSMGIPAISGITDVLRLTKTGDILALDGREGCLIVNPGAEVEAAYRKLQREYFNYKDHLIENRDQAALTKDGHTIDLLANINNVTDAQAAVEVGARGVGLFRTEYLFLTHPSIPDEEEQYQVYRQVLESCPNRALTIRTLDLGGDKTVAYLGSHRETNPFLGWRSIRMSFEHPDFFRRQIRAILRTGQHGKVRMMFPMISTVEELRRVNRMVWQVRRQLEKENVPFGDVELGIMLEVPAAAVCVGDLIEHTHFISIGTNDLVQYLMAADRDNPKVAHLCDPLNPAVLKLLKSTIDTCAERNIPVTVCGEMAGRPRCVLALLAFGLRSFSMSPAFVPIIKELIHSVKLADLNAIAKDVLQRKSSRLVKQFLDRVLHEVNPRLALLEAG